METAHAGLKTPPHRGSIPLTLGSVNPLKEQPFREPAPFLFPFGAFPHNPFPVETVGVDERIEHLLHIPDLLFQLVGRCRLEYLRRLLPELYAERLAVLSIRKSANDWSTSLGPDDIRDTVADEFKVPLRTHSRPP